MNKEELIEKIKEYIWRCWIAIGSTTPILEEIFEPEETIRRIGFTLITLKDGSKLLHVHSYARLTEPIEGYELIYEDRKYAGGTWYYKPPKPL